MKAHDVINNKEIDIPYVSFKCAGYIMRNHIPIKDLDGIEYYITLYDRGASWLLDTLEYRIEVLPVALT